jgi:NADH:ubiquinone oxidoreductase subunit 3 (subunit A)
MMSARLLLAPPVAFIIIFFGMVIVSALLSRCAFRKRKNSSEGEKAYACGEDFHGHLIQPDYSQFFPFAFFFTILHVVALVVATVPAVTLETFAIALVYVAGAIIGLLILLRK